MGQSTKKGRGTEGLKKAHYTMSTNSLSLRHWRTRTSQWQKLQRKLKTESNTPCTRLFARSLTALECQVVETDTCTLYDLFAPSDALRVTTPLSVYKGLKDQQAQRLAAKHNQAISLHHETTTWDKDSQYLVAHPFK